MTWRDQTVGDLVALQRGHDLTDQQRRHGFVPVIGSAGQNGFHDVARAKGPGVTIGRSGGSIGKVTFVEQDFWPHNTCIYVTDFKGNDPRFVSYLLGSIDLALLNSGAAQHSLNRNFVYGVQVSFPDPPQQRRIAKILSSYDDLIENNRRRMLLLEDAAQLIYEDWFLHFRLPGYQRTEEAVEKWTPLTLDDLCSIGRGASPRPIAQFMEGEIPWFKIGDATASESPYVFVNAEHVTDEGAKKSVVLQPRSLILSNSATCGIPFFTAVRGCIHDGWLHFAGLRRISPEFLYCYLKNKRNEVVSSVSDGSTQKNLNTSAVGRLRLLLPPTNSLLAEFDSIVQPLFSMIFNLAQQNISLRAARDLLLPRLMTGEVRVNS